MGTISSGGMGMTRHGQAFERLRKKAGLSKGDLCRMVGWERPQYYRICEKSLRGPSVETIERFLNALHLSWNDWAIAYGKPAGDAASRTTARARGRPHQKAS